MLVSCGDDSKKIIAGLTSRLDGATYNLQVCQSRLEMYTNPSTSNTNDSSSAPEPEEPSEPEYEEYEMYTLLSASGKTVNTTCDSIDSEPACGLTFSGCKNGYTYRCVVNAEYKEFTEKRLVTEQENVWDSLLTLVLVF